MTARALSAADRFSYIAARDLPSVSGAAAELLASHRGSLVELVDAGARLRGRPSAHHGRATTASCAFEMLTGDGPTGSTSSGLWYLAITGRSFGGAYRYVM